MIYKIIVIEQFFSLKVILMPLDCLSLISLILLDKCDRIFSHLSDREICHFDGLRLIYLTPACLTPPYHVVRRNLYLNDFGNQKTLK